MGEKFVNSYKKTIFTFYLHHPICIIRNTFSK